jgi:AraC-like DNA-binding protein
MRVAALIRESPAQAPAVADLAKEAGYSVDHFSRVFLKITGQRPQDYVINARIERSRQLLAESDLTIGGVAESVGFQDIFYFSRQFRQRTGQTPTEFRRGLRSREQ